MVATLERPRIRPKAPARQRIARVLLRAWRQGDAAQVLAVALVDGTFAVSVDGVLGDERFDHRQAVMLAASRAAWG